MKHLLILLFVPSISLSQKIGYDEIDEFDKSRRIFTESAILASGSDGTNLVFTAIRYTSEERDVDIYLKFNFHISKRGSIRNTDRVLIILTNGEVLKLKNLSSDEEVDVDSIGSIGVVISPETIELLAKQGTSKIRMETSSKNYDYEIPDKFLIRKYLRFLLEYADRNKD